MNGIKETIIQTGIIILLGLLAPFILVYSIIEKILIIRKFNKNIIKSPYYFVIKNKFYKLYIIPSIYDDRFYDKIYFKLYEKIDNKYKLINFLSLKGENYLYKYDDINEKYIILNKFFNKLFDTTFEKFNTSLIRKNKINNLLKNE